MFLDHFAIYDQYIGYCYQQMYNSMVSFFLFILSENMKLLRMRDFNLSCVWFSRANERQTLCNYSPMFLFSMLNKLTVVQEAHKFHR